MTSSSTKLPDRILWNAVTSLETFLNGYTVKTMSCPLIPYFIVFDYWVKTLQVKCIHSEKISLLAFLTLHLTWTVLLINWSLILINYWHYYEPCSPLEKFPSDNLFPGIRSTLSLQSKNVEKQNKDGITLGCHRDIFKYHCRKVKQSIARKNAKFYQDTSIECSDSESLFRVMDHLLKRISDNPVWFHLQSFTSAEDLSNRFANYLLDKITNIRAEILEKQKQDDYDYEPPSVNTPNLISFDIFCPATVEEIGKTIMCCPTTSCVLDLLPTQLLKNKCWYFITCYHTNS